MLKSRLSVACLFAFSTAAIAAPHGILPGDINRKGDACTDFYDYANGAWRAQNAIPSTMDRWSRRWQSGEVNKEHVREVSARSDWPQGSAQQLSGDFYAACMDESAIDALGLKPVQPMLDQARGITDRAGIARAITDFSALGMALPVAVYGQQDLHDPTIVVAHVDASGLGLPDRDYYLKTEARFVEARAT